jgi:hypothetical protein
MHKVGPPARAYSAAGQTLPAGGPVNTPIALDTISYDPAGAVDTTHYFGGTAANLTSARAWSGGTIANAFIVPAAGFYRCEWNVTATATAAGQRLAGGVWVNANTTSASSGGNIHSGAALILGVGASDIVECAQGDYIQLFAYSNAALVMVSVSGYNFLTVQQVA